VLAAFALSVAIQAPRCHGSEIEPIRVAAGTVLSFRVQMRMKSPGGDAIEASFPKGSVLQVKMLDSLDSTNDRDGAPFRGTVVSSEVGGSAVLLQSEPEVHGLLVLLRSQAHPEGFRYELLVTEIVENGKSYPITASLSSSLFDADSHASGSVQSGTASHGALDFDEIAALLSKGTGNGDLIGAIEKRGIRFRFDSKCAEDFRALGANEALLQALWSAKQYLDPPRSPSN
jgi:hypothetical protein